MVIDLKIHAENHKLKILNELNKMIDTVKLIEDFKKVEFDFLNYNKIDLKSLDLKNVIYVFKIRDFGEKGNNISFCNRIQTIKETRKKVKYPKVNSNNAVDENTTLYIGKSSGSFKNRIRQHLGLVSEKTYSLQLQSWLQFSDLSQVKLELYYTSIDFEKLGIKDHEEQKTLIELLETALHNHYKPLLGRSGH